jgi:hypothetical protein
MATRRKAIRLSPHEDRVLKELYLARRIPIDQYVERPTELAELTAEFNKTTGRGETSDDLVHFMKNERKNGRWPRLDGNHKAKPKPMRELEPEHVEVLISIYDDEVVQMGHCSDELSYNSRIASLIAKEFSARTHIRVPAHILVAKLDQLRKRGLLPKTEGRTATGGFTDIDDVVA